MSAEEFHYRIPWRARSAFPGSHAGRFPGSGFQISGYAPLHAAADPRRFDIRASLRDPFGQIIVRVYHQPGSVPVYGLADASGSMGFSGRVQKWAVLADFAAALAYSVHRAGDAFAFMGCDTNVRSGLTVQMTRDKSVAMTIGERLRAWVPDGKGSAGLLTAAERLPPTRALVFLLSDFHFPIALLKKILLSLSVHYVVPVVLWDPAEAQLPRFGIARLLDPESGARRTLLVRRSLGARLGQAFETRKNLLIKCFEEHGVTPLMVSGRLEADAVTRYFYG